jgi:hypothetical protein
LNSEIRLAKKEIIRGLGRMNKKFIMLIIFLFALGLVISGCSSNQGATTQKSDKPDASINDAPKNTNTIPINNNTVAPKNIKLEGTYTRISGSIGWKTLNFTDYPQAIATANDGEMYGITYEQSDKTLIMKAGMMTVPFTIVDENTLTYVLGQPGTFKKSS